MPRHRLPAGRGRCRGTRPPGRGGHSGSSRSAGLPRSTMRPCFSIRPASHSRSTSAMLWLASRIVQPLSARYCSSQVRTRSPVSGSRLAVGSSSSSTSGRLISDLASATRVFCPADNCPAGGPGSRRGRAPATVSRSGRPHAARYTDGHRPAGSPSPSAGAAARRRATRSSSAPAPRSGPLPCRGRARVMRPEVGTSRPSSMAIVVVLPAPLPPSSPTVPPAGTVKLMSSTASTSP